MNKIELPQNYIRVLSVTAKIIEEELNDLENLLSRNPEKYFIKDIHPSLSDTEKKTLLEKIKLLRDLNNKLFSELNLEHYSLTESQVIKGKTTYLWSILSDSKSKALKGYGELTTETAKFLDERIDALLAIVEEIDI